MSVSTPVTPPLPVDDFCRVQELEAGAFHLALVVNFPEKYRGRLKSDFMRAAVVAQQDELVKETRSAAEVALASHARLLCEAPLTGASLRSRALSAIDPEHSMSIDFDLSLDKSQGLTSKFIQEALSNDVFFRNIQEEVDQAIQQAVISAFSLDRKAGPGGH